MRPIIRRVVVRIPDETDRLRETYQRLNRWLRGEPEPQKEQAECPPAAMLV